MSLDQGEVNTPGIIGEKLLQKRGWCIVKVDRHGKAKVLTYDEINLLFSQGFSNLRDKALFGIMLYTACRIREAVTLRTVDVYDTENNKCRELIIIRKGNTKGKLATRSIPVVEDLRRILIAYLPFATEEYLFPGQKGKGRKYLHPGAASWLLKKALKKVNIQGASTHSFRRTALSHMSNAGIPLRIIQEISGHRNLDELQKYLEVTQEQLKGAISTLSMLSPIEKGEEQQSHHMNQLDYVHVIED